MTALRSDTSFVHQTSTPYRMSFKRHCVHPGKNCIAPSEEHRPKATAGLRLEPRLRVLSSAHHKTRVKSHSRAAMASRSLPRGHVKATASFHRRCGREFSVRRARSHRRPRRRRAHQHGSSRPGPGSLFSADGANELFQGQLQCSSLTPTRSPLRGRPTHWEWDTAAASSPVSNGPELSFTNQIVIFWNTERDAKMLQRNQ